MLYLTASQFDSFDLNNADLFLQAILLKTFAIEYANEMMNSIRLLFDIHQISSITSSQTVNVLNVLDSFLDSTTTNRMLLATYGLRNIGLWKYDYIAKKRLRKIYVKYYLKIYFFPKFYKKMSQRFPYSMDDFELLKKMHPSLQESINIFQQVIDIEKQIGDYILTLYGKVFFNFKFKYYIII